MEVVEGWERDDGRLAQTEHHSRKRLSDWIWRTVMEDKLAEGGGASDWRSRIGHARENHQIDVAADGMAPFPEFLGESPVLLDQSLGFEILQALMDKIQGVVDELGGLFRGHGLHGKRKGKEIARKICKFSRGEIRPWL